MTRIGYVVMAVGLAGLALNLTGAEGVIPPLAALNVPLAVWIGVAAVGGVVAMWTRQTRD